MNSFYFVLFYQFIFWITVGSVDYSPRLNPSDEVTLRLEIFEPKKLVINLKKTDTFLANENLPIYSVNKYEPDQLIPEKNVMKNIGRFTTYQDTEASSAAVYFHQRREFDGVIDSRFVIRNLSINNIDDTIFVYSDHKTIGVLKRHDRYQHRRSILTKNQGNKLIPTREKFINKAGSTARIKRSLPDVVYIKALLIVGPDIVNGFFGEDDDDYTAIISHLLTQFNNIDMLYSKIVKPQIRINIAAIIMGIDENAFPFLSGCYQIQNDIASDQNYLDVHCIDLAIQRYVQTNLKIIPQNSYDIAIYITSLPLWNKEINSEIIGVTNGLEAGPYTLRQFSQKRVPCITFRDTKDFATYVTLAHEIAHALRFPFHDQAPYVDENGNCCSFIMRSHGSYCQKCLSWSSNTIEHFKEFFSSSDGCFFINKPLSLKTPGPRKISSANQQCQCYGYTSAKVKKIHLLDNICGIDRMCENNLQCVDKKGNLHTAPYPNDGTPCGKSSSKVKKVCWNRSCVPQLYHEHMYRSKFILKQ